MNKPISICTAPPHMVAVYAESDGTYWTEPVIAITLESRPDGSTIVSGQVIGDGPFEPAEHITDFIGYDMDGRTMNDAIWQMRAADHNTMKQHLSARGEK